MTQLIQAHKWRGADGHLYDSRLEADWAATLRTYNVKYQAHPGTIVLPTGEYYEPDFFVPGIGSDAPWGWLLEVKGEHGERLWKVDAARTLNPRVVVGHEFTWPYGYARWSPPLTIFVRWHDGNLHLLEWDNAVEFDTGAPAYEEWYTSADVPSGRHLVRTRDPGHRVA